MGNEKILKLDRSTKVLYSLFNFFAPISFTCVILCTFNVFNVKATLFSLLAILVGLFCLISNLIKYNRFLCIDDKAITVCEGAPGNPKVLQLIRSDDITSAEINNNLTMKYDNKKIKLLHTSFSLLGVILFIGPLVFIPVLKNINSALHIMVDIYEKFPAFFKTPPKKTNETYDIFVNVLAWGFVIFVTLVGCIGILLTPFYPFLNS